MTRKVEIQRQKNQSKQNTLKDTFERVLALNNLVEKNRLKNQ